MSASAVPAFRAAHGDTVPAPPAPLARATKGQRGGAVAQKTQRVPPPPLRQCAEVFKKTTACRFYPRCSKGDKCRFAHAADELRIRPNLSKTRMCAGFYDGRCMLSSEECSFAHGEHELRARQVPYFGQWSGGAGNFGAGSGGAVDRNAFASNGSGVMDSNCFASKRFGAIDRNACMSNGSTSDASVVSACGRSGRSTPTTAVATAPASVGSDCTTPVITPQHTLDAFSFGEDSRAPSVVGDYGETLDVPTIVTEDPRVEVVLKSWMQRIHAMSSPTTMRSAETGHLPSTDECLAALMKAMPESYED